MKYNKAPILVTEGRAFLNGIEVMDMVNCKIVVTVNAWEGKQVGEKTKSTRWKDYDIKVTMTRRRSTPFLKKLLKNFTDFGGTPEFTIQGTQLDKNSDYYKEYGTDTITVVGCVPVGDITVLEIDADGDTLDDVITFNAKAIV